MKYNDMVAKIAKTDVSEIERAENLIRSMTKVINAMFDYKYVADHYVGGPNSTMLQDKVNIVAKELAIMISDADIYMETLGVTDKVHGNAEYRVKKILAKIEGKS